MTVGSGPDYEAKADYTAHTYFSKYINRASLQACEGSSETAKK